MKKACVIGWPIAHSRSPIIHNYWLAQHGIDGLYEKREVKPEELRDFLSTLEAQGYVGCNVTIPHKETARALVPNLDEVVKRTGSLNTIYVRNGVLNATSTDGEGFWLNLKASVPDFEPKGARAIILGAGGSARAVVDRLVRVGFGEVWLLNRTEARARELAAGYGQNVKVLAPDRFGNESKTASLLVNTTSQGMKGQPELEVDLSALPSSAVVADLIYVPLETELVKRAKARGLKAVGGLGMLLHQATLGFKLWFGVKPEVTQELYRLVARDVDPGYAG
jgi:shikimate dehydrogenase